MSKEGSIQRSIDRIQRSAKSTENPEILCEKIRSGDRVALGRAITLLESSNAEKRAAGLSVLDLCMPHTGNARRIGVTGVPGVGKSTFIEQFGTYLVAQGHTLAVLAIDPSSQRSGGSILGDKTRMESLSTHPKAYVRPSPAGEALGGVAARTREAILLCEAAGYDTILIETVGVGQSETAVHSMVDFFLLLMLAGAGDELQGIKRGIMEMADMVLINKADGGNEAAAKKARAAYKNALHLFPAKASNWTTVVDTCSALEGMGMETVAQGLDKFFGEHKAYVESNRGDQNIHWMREAVNDLIRFRLLGDPDISVLVKELEDRVRAGQINAFSAADQVFAYIQKHEIK